MLDAPPPPVVLVAPKREIIALQTPLRYPPVADLAQPMLRLAGLRIDPATNGIHHAPATTGHWHSSASPTGASSASRSRPART